VFFPRTSGEKSVKYAEGSGDDGEPEQEGRMSLTVEAIYAVGLLKPFPPLHEIPESEHTKVCLKVEALPATEPHESIIAVQRQHWSPPAESYGRTTGRTLNGI